MMAADISGAFQSLTAAWTGAVGRVRTRSVIAPLLALDSMVGLFAFGMSWTANPTVANNLWLLFMFCVGATILAYFFFAIMQPERLQTEEFRLAKLKARVIGDERDPNDAKIIEATPTSNTHITVPQPEAAT